MVFNFTTTTEDATLFVPYLLYTAILVLVYNFIQFTRFSKSDERSTFVSMPVASFKVIVTVVVLVSALVKFSIEKDDLGPVAGNFRDPQDYYAVFAMSYTGLIMLMHGGVLMAINYADLITGYDVAVESKFGIALSSLNWLSMGIIPVVMASFVFARNQQAATTDIIDSNTSVYLLLASALLLIAQAGLIVFKRDTKSINLKDTLQVNLVGEAENFLSLPLSFLTMEVTGAEEGFVYGYMLFMSAGYVCLYADQVQAAIAIAVTIGIPFFTMFAGNDYKFFIPSAISSTFAFYAGVYLVSAFSLIEDATGSDANFNIMTLAPAEANTDNFLSTIKVLVLISFVYNCVSALYTWSYKGKVNRGNYRVTANGEKY